MTETPIPESVSVDRLLEDPTSAKAYLLNRLAALDATEKVAEALMVAFRDAVPFLDAEIKERLSVVLTGYVLVHNVLEDVRVSILGNLVVEDIPVPDSP